MYHLGRTYLQLSRELHINAPALGMIPALMFLTLILEFGFTVVFMKVSGDPGVCR